LLRKNSIPLTDHLLVGTRMLQSHKTPRHFHQRRLRTQPAHHPKNPLSNHLNRHTRGQPPLTKCTTRTITLTPEPSKHHTTTHKPPAKPIQPAPATHGPESPAPDHPQHSPQTPQQPPPYQTPASPAPPHRRRNQPSAPTTPHPSTPPDAPDCRKPHAPSQTTS